MLSLFSFMMALGIVVDDAIVIGENIYAHIQMDKSLVNAAIDGTVGSHAQCDGFGDNDDHRVFTDVFRLRYDGQIHGRDPVGGDRDAGRVVVGKYFCVALSPVPQTQRVLSVHGGLVLSAASDRNPLELD